MPRTLLLIQGQPGIKHVAAILGEFRTGVERYGVVIDEEVVWNQDNNLTETLHSLKRGDYVFTDTLEVFGDTQEAVRQVFTKVIMQGGVKVYIATRLGLTEVTPQVLEIILVFSTLDVKLISNAA